MARRHRSVAVQIALCAAGLWATIALASSAHAGRTVKIGSAKKAKSELAHIYFNDCAPRARVTGDGALEAKRFEPDGTVVQEWWWLPGDWRLVVRFERETWSPAKLRMRDLLWSNQQHVLRETSSGWMTWIVELLPGHSYFVDARPENPARIHGGESFAWVLSVWDVTPALGACAPHKGLLSIVDVSGDSPLAVCAKRSGDAHVKVPLDGGLAPTVVTLREAPPTALSEVSTAPDFNIVISAKNLAIKTIGGRSLGVDAGVVKAKGTKNTALTLMTIAMWHFSWGELRCPAKAFAMFVQMDRNYDLIGRVVREELPEDLQRLLQVRLGTGEAEVSEEKVIESIGELVREMSPEEGRALVARIPWSVTCIDVTPSSEASRCVILPVGKAER